MGIEKVGIGIISDIVKTKGGSILRTKPNVFHGINPTLRYTENGKSFALPRFCSKEMQEARKMNQIAIRQAKAGDVFRFYPKATSEDLSALCDKKLSTIWTNPKDGKIYCLVKQGETENGNIILRILDEEGAFIKEAQIPTKKIMIYDTDCRPINLGNCYEQLSHGELVQSFVERYNPFAKIEFINIDRARTQNSPFNLELNLGEELSKLHQRVLKGEKVDYISLSFGMDSSIVKPEAILSKSGKTMEEFKRTDISLPTSKFLALHPEVRILQAAGNSGAKSISPDLMVKGVEGVGALDTIGRIANFSSTRTSLLTQHYEKGVFRPVIKNQGISFVEGSGVDVPIKPEYYARAEKYIKSKLKTVESSLDSKIVNLRNAAEQQYKEEFARRRAQIVTAEEDAKLAELKTIWQKEKDPIKCKQCEKQYWDYHCVLFQKVKKTMQGYENKAGLEYKRIVKLLEEEGYLHKSCLRNQYVTFNMDPYGLVENILHFISDKWGGLRLVPAFLPPLQGTSFSTPIRTAKLALNDMMEGIL